MRVKRGTVKKKRHKKYLKAAKGYAHAKSHRYRNAKNQVEKSMQYSTRDRKVKKRETRKSWITKIGIACRMNGMSYSKFISGLKKANILLDRKQIQNITAKDGEVFKQLIALSKESK